MKTGKILLPFICLFLISCGEDRRIESAGRLAESRMIKNIMDENYYWYAEIDSSDLNYYQNAELFFKSLLVSSDKYSTIEVNDDYNRVVTRASNTATYGFEYDTKAHPEKSNALIARVLYTLPDSPAEISGLKRGDWIIGINDTTLTNNNLDSLYHATKGLRLRIGSVVVSEDGESVVEKEPVTLPPGSIVEDNPIYYSSVIEHAGKRIGYLVYNSFTSGRSETDETYLNELSALSNKFKSEGIEEFILDLRYNLGGELNRPVPLMCTMLAPANAMGEVMGYPEFNDKNTSKNIPIYFDQAHLYGGVNLDLSRVFVLVNKKFTASASEAVINFLDPYMESVQIIGSGTVGKNVGSQAYKDIEGCIMHPIVCKLFNSKGESEYSSGFPPIITKDELDIKVTMYPLGDKNELLLATALSVIDGSYNPNPEPESRSATQPKTYKSSLDRKSLPGVIIR